MKLKVACSSRWLGVAAANFSKTGKASTYLPSWKSLKARLRSASSWYAVATPANALVRQISTRETARQKLRERRSSKYSRDLFDIVASFEVGLLPGQEGSGSLGAAL